MRNNIMEPIYIMLVELIFIFLHNVTKPMTIVMKHYSNNGNTSQDIAFCATQHHINSCSVIYSVCIVVHIYHTYTLKKLPFYRYFPSVFCYQIVVISFIFKNSRTLLVVFWTQNIIFFVIVFRLYTT